MKVTDLFRLRLAAAVTLAIVIGQPGLATAESVSFTIDPTKSSYHFVNVIDDPSPVAPLQDSTVLGVPLIAQVPGAATDALSGTILADETGGPGGLLTFDGSSTITPIANPAGPFAPSQFPGTDSFGLVTNATTPVGSVITVAIRDWEISILSGTASNGALPSDGSLNLGTTQGYQVNSFSGQVSIVGQTGPDVATTPISLTTAYGIETLVLPVIRLPVPGAANQPYLEGTIVAARQVSVAGDVNFDDIVNGQDIALIASNWLSTGSNVPGDGNGDGIVNGQDIALVASNWLGTFSGGGTSASVPEPGAFFLMASGLAAAGFAAWKRARRGANAKRGPVFTPSR